MKILNKMDSDVTYTIGKEKFTLLKNQENELDRRIAEHPVFKQHLKNGVVEILTPSEPRENGNEGETFETKEDEEKYRQELLQKCKDKGIKVNPNTGIDKLKAKLEESSATHVD